MRAFSNLSTTLRSPLTSSFSFPVSPNLSSSYSSSFSSCSTLVRCVSAAVTVVDETVEGTGVVAPVMWGSRRETKAGGSDSESVVDGPGWVDRYWRSWVTSSCENGSAEVWDGICCAHREFYELVISLVQQSLKLDFSRRREIHDGNPKQHSKHFAAMMGRWKRTWTSHLLNVCRVGNCQTCCIHRAHCSLAHPRRTSCLDRWIPSSKSLLNDQKLRIVVNPMMRRLFSLNSRRNLRMQTQKCSETVDSRR